jgi:hypothetical protein
MALSTLLTLMPMPCWLSFWAMTAAPEPMIRLEALTKHYPGQRQPAVDGHEVYGARLGPHEDLDLLLGMLRQLFLGVLEQQGMPAMSSTDSDAKKGLIDKRSQDRDRRSCHYGRSLFPEAASKHRKFSEYFPLYGRQQPPRVSRSS